LTKKSRNLKDFTYDELLELVSGLGERPYRAAQLYGWFFRKGARAIDEMTDISKVFRNTLKQGSYYIGLPALTGTKHSGDGTVKLLFELEDSERIESVLIPEEKRLTLCVSTQAGCALGCSFCMTGMYGPGRNLILSEMTGEVHVATGLVKEGLLKDIKRITNVVLMGMGEPLANYEEVLKFINVLTDPKGLGFSSGKVTVSTAGLTPGIKRLGRDASVNLAVSLNATTDRVRSQIMPINKKYPLGGLLAALMAYPLRRGKRITIEYVLMKDLNDTPEDARRLARLLKGIPTKINLIALNPPPGSPFKRPETKRIGAFQKILMEAHYDVIVRASRGSDIMAACGQLRGRKQKALTGNGA
jgi:23S rRNA (adenine2503-C2)-methyltransferase